MLEVGSLTDVITVSSPLRNHPDGNGRPRRRPPRRADRQPVGRRPQLARAAAHPARRRVRPTTRAFESVSFGGGANNTQGYTVNGIRSSGNTVSLDGSALIDIGSNSGVIVTLNNDMVQEVKVQSSNFAAEFGAGGMNISAVTKAGGVAVPRRHLRLHPRFASSQANDRSNSIAGIDKPKSKFKYPGGNVGGPTSSPASTRSATRCSSSSAIEVAAPAGRPRCRGSASSRRSSSAPATSRSSPPQRPEPRPAGRHRAHPGGFPNAGQPAPGNNLSPYITPHRPRAGQPLPGAELQHDPTNQFNYVYSQLEPTNRNDLKMRFDYNITHNTKAYVRVAIEE